MATDDGMVPDDDGEVESYFGIQCERCGNDGFHWEKTNWSTWRLHDEYGELYICQPYRKE